jgi:hypothetical protein
MSWVVEVRLHAGRSPYRLLYIHQAPEVIEIVRVVRTGREAPASFAQAVRQTQKAAQALAPERSSDAAAQK